MGFSNIGEGRQTRQRPWGRRSELGLVNEDGERRAKPLQLVVITQESTQQNISVILNKLENSENQDTVTGTRLLVSKQLGDNVHI